MGFRGAAALALSVASCSSLCWTMPEVQPLHPSLPRLLVACRQLRRGHLRLRGGAGSLHEAAASGSVYDIEEWACRDMDQLDEAGLSALHRAVEAGHLGVAALLVAKGADVDVPDTAECTPLHHAAARGQVGAVIVLIDLGAAVAASDECGWTPLHHAAASQQRVVLQILLNAGADAHAADLRGRSPLHVCGSESSSLHSPTLQGRGDSSRPGAGISNPPFSLGSSNSHSSTKELLESAMNLTKSPGAVAPKHSRALEHETRREDVDPWLQLESAGETPLESMHLANIALHPTLQPDSAGKNSPPLEECGSNEPEGAVKGQEIGGQAVGDAEHGNGPLERGDTVDEEHDPDEILLQEILSEIGGNYHQEGSGGDSELDSVTVSEFTSQGGIDPELALSFKAAKMAFPYEAPPQPRGVGVDVADTFDPQEDKFPEEIAGSLGNSVKVLEDRLAYMTQALPRKVTALDDDAASKEAGVLPIDPTLGYYKEADGSWVGFNGLGEMVPVACDDPALIEWRSCHD